MLDLSQSRWSWVTLQRLLDAVPAPMEIEHAGKVIWRNASSRAADRNWLLGECPGPSRQALSSECYDSIEALVELPDGSVLGCRIIIHARPSRRSEAAPSLLRLSNPVGSSGIDPPTALLDREAIVQRLTTEVARSRRYGNPLSVVLLVPDCPDDPPRPVRSDPGAELPLMHWLALMLREETRWSDHLGRLGPEEFLIVLPETALHAVSGLERKIGQRMADADPRIRRVEWGAAEWQPRDDERRILARSRASLRPLRTRMP